jgi:hypothetical protein
MFGQLPSELRVLIWKTASFITRNVDITIERRGSIRCRPATRYQKKKDGHCLAGNIAIPRFSKMG